MFFLLEQKEPKIQESRIPQPGGLQAFARLGGYLYTDDLATDDLSDAELAIQ